LEGKILTKELASFMGAGQSPVRVSGAALITLKDSPINGTSEAVNIDTGQLFFSAWH